MQGATRPFRRAMIGFLGILGLFLSPSAPTSAQEDDWDKGLSPIELGESYAREYLSQPAVAVAFYRALTGLGTAVPPGNADIAEAPFWEIIIEQGLHQQYGLPEDADRWEVIRTISSYHCRDSYIRRDLYRLMETRSITDPYVQAWLADRLKLMAFCGGMEPLPDPDGWSIQTLDDPPFRVIADVDYLNAVAQFYEEDYAAAIPMFEALASKPGNAHQDAARTMLVDIWTGVNWDDTHQDLDKARNLLRRWRGQHAMDDFSLWAYESAVGMLTYTTRSDEDARLDVQTTLRVLSRPNDAVRQDPILRRRMDRVLADLDEFVCLGYRVDECPDGPRSSALMAHVVSDPIARFLDTAFNLNHTLRPGMDPYYLSGRVLRLDLPGDIDIPSALTPLDRDGLAWLVLAMEFAVPGNSDLPEIQSRSDALADKVAAGTASVEEQIAWPSLFRSRLRQYLDAGEHEAALQFFKRWQSGFSEDHLRHLQCDWAARAILNGEPDQARDVLDLMPLDLSHREYFHSCSTSLTFYLAENLEEAWVALQGNVPERTRASFLNLLPSAEALHLLEEASLPPDATEAAARATLGRALVLRREDLWQGGLRVLSTVNPDAAAALVESAGSATALPDPDLADLTLLRFPRLRLRVYRPVHPWILDEDLELLGDWRAIDIYQHTANNYWCEFDPDASIQAMVDDLAYDFLASNYWGTPETKAAGRRAAEVVMQDHPILTAMDEIEIARLVAVDAAPLHLPRIALQLSNRFSAGRTHQAVGEDEVAEALHLAVRATRYSCPEALGRGKGSRAAWRRLDDDHRDSDWMARTPYWYGDWPYW